MLSDFFSSFQTQTLQVNISIRRILILIEMGGVFMSLLGSASYKGSTPPNLHILYILRWKCKDLSYKFHQIAQFTNFVVCNIWDGNVDIGIWSSVKSISHIKNAHCTRTQKLLSKAVHKLSRLPELRCCWHTLKRALTFHPTEASTKAHHSWGNDCMFEWK